MQARRVGEQLLATPMVGGLFSAALLTLVVLPASYMLIQRYRYREQLQAAEDRHAEIAALAAEPGAAEPAPGQNPEA